MIETSTLYLGALTIGLYLGNKGITAIDLHTKKINIYNVFIISCFIASWDLFYKYVLT